MHIFKDIHTFWVHGSTMFFPLILLQWAILKKFLGSAQQQNNHCDRNRSLKGDCMLRAIQLSFADLPPLKHEWFVWRWQHQSPDGSYPQVALPRSEFSSVESRAAGYSFCESGVELLIWWISGHWRRDQAHPPRSWPLGGHEGYITASWRHIPLDSDTSLSLSKNHNLPLRSLGFSGTLF